MEFFEPRSYLIVCYRHSITKARRLLVLQPASRDCVTGFTECMKQGTRFCPEVIL